MSKVFAIGAARSVPVLACLAVGFVASSPAAANPPTTGPLEVIPYEFSVDCSTYGFAFEIETRGQESVRRTTFSDATGNPVKEVVHDAFDETDTNTVSGKTVRFSGRNTETFDLVGGTRTVIGKMFMLTDPGTGAVIHDAGRVVFDAPFHVSFEAGRHDVLHGNIDRLVCTALAG